ncbi:uncharacterized protein LOC109787699 [Cajanus cajan]|uniref:uncharacterized protein LOC109787699 n=1 Tax=Cajanus cajan TaxID=3821 RepID=UPI00098DA939|nr:uncharacterized protein LOC109787699 [Cajanus cajan]
MEDSTTSQIMSHLTDSLIAQLTQLHPSLSINPHHASLIQRRLQNLLPTLHTPTHPPYALMIRNAIIGLKEEEGSTEEAISGFIRREYNDLPWAHAKILGMQLEKLCQIGEIACAEGGRFALVDEEDDETKEQCESRGKRKRVNRRRNVGDGDSFEEGESQEGQPQVVGQQCQDSMLHLETNCSSQPTAMKCLPAAGSGLSPAQFQMQVPCNGPSENSLDAAVKMSGSLSLNVQESKQDEDLMTRHPDQQWRGRWPRKCKQNADHQEESLLLSDDVTVIDQEPNEKEIDEQCLSQSQGMSRGRGHKLLRNANGINKKIHPEDEAEDMVCSSYSKDKETSSSFQPATPNSPVNPTHNSGQQLVVPTSEGSPECIISTGIKLPSTQLQQQITSGIDLVTVSKRKASLNCESIHDEQPLHCNQGSPKRNLDENPMSRDSEERPLKRPRGRPPKLDTGSNHPGESLLPSDDDIHNEQRQHQNGRGRGRTSRGRGLGRGRGRCLGRPPKLNQITEQCEEQLQRGYQDKQHGRRGRGRPPKLNGNLIQYKESQQEDQTRKHSRGRGRGRPSKLNGNPVQYQEQSQQEDEGQQHGRGRGQGRPSNLHYFRGRSRGRPPKLNQNTSEEQLQPQDQAQGLMNSPCSGRNDNQSLHVQRRGRHHKSESGEPRLGSESRCGSGEVSQSKAGANRANWVLKPLPNRLTQKKNEVIGNFNRTHVNVRTGFQN